MASPQAPYYTPEEYLALEDAALDKHEYHDGRIYAMSGAGLNHNLLTGNVFAALHAQLRGRSCNVFGSDMRVRVEATGLYTYPDVSALCGAARFDAHATAILLNPTVIVEVLSPSTESYDRGQKFTHYRRIASLREYVLIAQDAAHVERFTRQREEDAAWTLVEADGMESAVALESIGCVLHLRDVYDRVTLPPAPPLRAVYESAPDYVAVS